MKTIQQKPAWGYIAFFLAVLLSRIPFLFHGFGLDSDSWGVALAARAFHDQGIYEASRFPGFPVHELLSALTISQGYFLTNLLVAVISSAGILFFVMSLRHLRFKYPYLGGAVLAAVPVLYISSVVTHDFALALAFLLMGLYFILRGSPVVAGIFLGIAIGCRMTSGAMLIPFAILVAQNDGVSANAGRIFRLVAATLITGVFAYLPVISQYGFSFLTYESLPYPTLSAILFRMFPEMWGLPGLAALAIGLVVLMLPHGKAPRRFLFPRSVNEKHVVAWLIAIDLYIIAFLKLPSEPGYLLPIVPFVILLFGKYLYSTTFFIFSGFLLASPFVLSVAPSGSERSMEKQGTAWTVDGESMRIQPLVGPVQDYESRRRHDMRSMDSLFSRLNTLEDLSLVVAGSRFKQLQFSKVKMLHNDRVTFVEYINAESLARYFGNGYDLYYLPGAEQENSMRYNFKITDLYDAQPLSF